MNTRSQLKRFVHGLAKITVRISERLAERTMSMNELLPDQGVVKSTLEELVRGAAKPNMRALEIGSWLGASTAIIAQVVKENNGQLYCVDWWKGNLGPNYGAVNLGLIAQNYDVFSLFQKNMEAFGVSDTVLPLKMRSQEAAPILKDGSFDFIFIDGEHSYQTIKSDIENYLPKVKLGGLICGHDCEGKIEQYDIDHLHAYKNSDTDPENKLHCGVILAVGEHFKDYSVENCIWYAVAKASVVVKS